MAIRADVPLKLGGDVTRCPVCGSPVRIVYRSGKHADHYEPVQDQRMTQLAPMDKVTARKLEQERKGKKTVAIVGMAPTSCSLAPYNDKNVEVWGLNEAHSFDWMLRWDRWFQLHKSTAFTRDMNPHRSHERGYVKGHYDWLKQKHGKPIYMQFVYPEIPDSKEYPLPELSKKFFPLLRKGSEKVKYFTSSFSFMMALALYEGFERVEVYGFEMSAGDEFIPQKACAEFWMGMALGMGVEVYLPDNSQLLWGALYGYQDAGS